LLKISEEETKARQSTMRMSIRSGLKICITHTVDEWERTLEEAEVVDVDAGGCQGEEEEVWVQGWVPILPTDNSPY